MPSRLLEPNEITGADEELVRSLYHELMDAWNVGSGERFAAPFTEDADFVAFDGTHMHGQEEIARSHHQLFTHWLAGSTLVGKVTDVRFLGNDVAVMHAVGGTVMPGETDINPERNSIQTLVVARTGEDWRIVAFQNTRVNYMGRPELNAKLTEELRALV